MSTRMDEVWTEQQMLVQTDDEEMFRWYEEQADLELQAAKYQDEWREYVKLN